MMTPRGPCQHQSFCSPVISDNLLLRHSEGQARELGAVGLPGVAGQSLADRAHPTLAGQSGAAGGSPGASSRHWASPWGQGRAETRPGCQPVGGCASAGPMARPMAVGQREL